MQDLALNRCISMQTTHSYSSSAKKLLERFCLRVLSCSHNSNLTKRIDISYWWLTSSIPHFHAISPIKTSIYNNKGASAPGTRQNASAWFRALVFFIQDFPQHRMGNYNKSLWVVRKTCHFTDETAHFYNFVRKSMGFHGRSCLLLDLSTKRLFLWITLSVMW